MPIATVRRRGGDPKPTGWGVDTWRPIQGVAPPWEQVGLYGIPYLSQFPARWEGAQLFCGVEGMNSRYQEPYRVQNAWRSGLSNTPGGGQRMGQTFTGAIGPLNVRGIFSRITAAQIRQSGLSAYAWAQQMQGA